MPEDNTIHPIALNWQEVKTLHWAASRYESAHLLYVGLIPGAESGEYWLGAKFIRLSHAAIPGDGSEGDLIPCIGGDLGKKITALFRAAGV